MKFTPGPWTADDMGIYIFANDKQGNPFPVAEVRGWGHLSTEYGEEKAENIQKGNARAIASVPEMVGLLCQAMFALAFRLERTQKDQDIADDIAALMHRIGILETNMPVPYIRPIQSEEEKAECLRIIEEIVKEEKK